MSSSAEPLVVRTVLCLAVPVALALVAGGAPPRGESHETPSVLLTADTEGHVGPCATCPLHVGLGGLARRATAIARERHAGPLLLLDAGNAFFGGDSAASGGKVIAAAYDALGYDAVNISYRDFRDGPDATLALLHGVRFDAVSANLADEATGKLLFKPFIVRTVAGRSVAIIGVTEVPEGLELLPHLRKQLAGVIVRPPLDALEQWLPAAKAQADTVILLYYGSPAGLEPVLRRYANDLSLVLVGGSRQSEWRADSRPTVISSEEHGKSVALARFGGPGVEQIPVAPTLPPDPAMQRLVASFVADGRESVAYIANRAGS